MSCNPPCCKRDPERQCPICFTDQTWAMEIPSPIEFISSSVDKIVDGAGDASVGTCGTGTGGRDGSNGYDSHTYIEARNKGKASLDWLVEVGTEDGDSLSRNPPALWDETLICNQFIGDRIYGVTHIKNRDRLTGPASPITLPFIHDINIRGEFYIPSAPVLAGTFTKTFEFRSGADRGTSDISLWDRVGDADFKAGLQRRAGYFNHEIAWLNHWHFNSIVQLTGSLQFLAYDLPGGFVGTRPIPVINGDDITSDDYTNRSLNDRRLILNTNAINYDNLYDTGLTLGDYIDGGTFVRITVEQTGVVVNLSGRFTITADVTYSIPESQFSVTEQVTQYFSRCNNGFVRLKGHPAMKNQTHFPIDGPFENDGISNNGWRLANHDPAWWVNEINRRAEDFPEPNEDKQHMMLFPWINHFEITNGNFSDTANFIVVRFLHKDSSGAIKQAVYATDYAGVTIPDGTEINIGEVIAGDTFELGLDNLGEATTEVTAITFDTPFISTVDDSTPTLLPYDFTTVSFTTSAADTGSSDIVITHDKNNLLIPSPWTLTLTTQSGPIDGGGAGI